MPVVNSATECFKFTVGRVSSNKHLILSVNLLVLERFYVSDFVHCCVCVCGGGGGGRVGR